MTNMKKRIAAALTSATLTIGLTIPTMAAETSGEPIRVSSYKGSILEMGERSGLIIGPSGADYTVISSAPDVVAVEQVLTFWVAIAKAERSVEITASNSAGECGSMTLTALTEETSLASFVSGFQLALGIAGELTPYSFARDEEDRAEERRDCCGKA